MTTREFLWAVAVGTFPVIVGGVFTLCIYLDSRTPPCVKWTHPCWSNSETSTENRAGMERKVVTQTMTFFVINDSGKNASSVTIRIPRGRVYDLEMYCSPEGKTNTLKPISPPGGDPVQVSPAGYDRVLQKGERLLVCARYIFDDTCSVDTARLGDEVQVTADKETETICLPERPYEAVLIAGHGLRMSLGWAVVSFISTGMAAGYALRQRGYFLKQRREKEEKQTQLDRLEEALFKKEVGHQEAIASLVKRNQKLTAQLLRQGKPPDDPSTHIG